jgi:SepF-like predicted cell division protein (DUF552 family)
LLIGLFRKEKKPQEEEKTAEEEQPEETPAEGPQETPQAPESPETPEESPETMPEPEPAVIAEMPQEQKQPREKTYLKAMPLKELADVEKVKIQVRNGNIIILRITPLANKSIQDVKQAVNQLYEFTENTHGDIARLGEERVVICPPNIRIWREKPKIANQPVPTAA